MIRVLRSFRFAAHVLVIAAFSAPIAGCYTYPYQDSSDSATYRAEAAAENDRSASMLQDSATRCSEHWTVSCDVIEKRLAQSGCGSANDPNCQATVNAIEAAASRAICTEGSIAECEAACDGGRLATCVTLAQMLHAGARVVADPDRADRILVHACDRGRSDACLQRGIWIQTVDTDEAADLFMRACDTGRTNGTTAMSCALWMSLLDQHAYDPEDRDEIAGLSRICSLEEEGALVPGSTLVDGALTVRYVGGACGRLKDLGMAPGRSLSEKSAVATPAPTNPYAPKW